MKDVRSRREGCVQCGHFSDNGEGGSADANICTFCSIKLGVFEIDGSSARMRGLNQMCGQDESIFGNFVRMSFMNGPK